LKIDKFLVFVTGFHRSISLAAALQLLWQELLSFILGQPTKAGFTQGWRELSVLTEGFRGN